MNLSIAGTREFPHDANVRDRLVRPLEREDGKVIRRISSDLFEFRHDQMRAYLAALWLVDQAANLESILVHLNDEAIWIIAAQDQEEVWYFTAILLPRELVSPVWNFAIKAPERVRLQHALQDAAVERAIKLILDPVPKKRK